MSSVLLIYPFFRPPLDRSEFRFPPLGVAYVAASLQAAGQQVSILDCTFLSRENALREARSRAAEVVGIYCMVTMEEDSLLFARALRESAELLVAGGPMPTSNPALFLEHFDVVVMGEGERAMVQLLAASHAGIDPMSVPGIAVRTDGPQRSTRGKPVPGVLRSPQRPMEPDLDCLPFPARKLLPNDRYIAAGRRRYGRSITTVMTTRGCPFSCEFCSNEIFGTSYRARSPANVVDEVEQALSLGYERIHFADDVFTLDRKRVRGICEEILRRGLHFRWECLGRVDSLDRGLAQVMKEAGCRRIFFGIESGHPRILRLMNKRITPSRARNAVVAARQAGVRTGAFFILYYPGETDATVRATLRFALSLPLDYLSFTMPYPIPGTALHARVKDRTAWRWRQGTSFPFDHTLIFDADHSQAKMRFAILKGEVEFALKRTLGRFGPLALPLLSKPTDLVLRLMR
jgi:anaerobic magnesium-protoporphyrin IX monomethyl ester cyclase